MIEKYLTLLIFLLCFYKSHNQEIGCYPKSKINTITPTLSETFDLCKLSCKKPYFSFNAYHKECYCYDKLQVINYNPETEKNETESFQNDYIPQDIFEQINTKEKRLLEFKQDLFNTGYIGAGYSYDTLSLTSEKCFKTQQITITESSADLGLSKAHLFDELDLKLNFSLKTHLGIFLLFRISAKLEVEAQLKTTDTSFSLSYIQFVQRTVTGQVEGYGVDSLSDFGKGVYLDGENPFFSVVCGDEYVTRYNEGGYLIISMNLKFVSVEAKLNFFEETKAHIFLGIFGMKQQLKIIADAQLSAGVMELVAFQYGGDPAQLTKVYSIAGKQESKGAFQCELSNLSGCDEALESLVNYASNIFPTQFEQNGNTGYIPLGEKYTEFRPISYLGLKKSQSLVYDQIKEKRKYLLEQLEIAIYYKVKLQAIRDRYDGEYLNQPDFQKAFDKVENNLKFLKSEKFPRIGIEGCYTRPNECIRIAEYIEKHIQPIQFPDMEFASILKGTYGFVPKYQDYCIPINFQKVQVGDKHVCFNDESYYCQQPLLCKYSDDDNENYQGVCEMCKKHSECGLDKYCQEDGENFNHCQDQEIVSEVLAICNIEGKFKCGEGLFCQHVDRENWDKDSGVCVKCLDDSQCDQDNNEICDNQYNDYSQWRCIVQDIEEQEEEEVIQVNNESNAQNDGEEEREQENGNANNGFLFGYSLIFIIYFIIYI